LNDAEIQNNVIFIGDSPNDSLMFGFFNNSVGVANVKELMNNIENSPKYITSNFSGDGFVELADLIIDKK
jgi:hydroxymethylpyrimidine pyrophosphatase-like HAD family hydrolase